MNKTLDKKSWSLSLLFVVIASLFLSCHKDINPDGFDQPADLITKVNSSVSGFVTDEFDGAVIGATVVMGTGNVTTDKFGYFEIKNVQVVKNASCVTVSKTGYFKGIKTYMAVEGKPAFLRIKLIPKKSIGQISSSTGGNVSMVNGLNISLPAGAVMNAATNAAYSGTINITAYWLNPEASDITRIMPGDLQGINAWGSMKILNTYGMAAIELTGGAGELLQLAPGKKATLTIKIPATYLSSAPSSIALWYFDETTGLWREEGSAVKSGDSYVGDVNHFSFWNCDVSANFVYFDGSIGDAVGNPLSSALVKVSVVSDPANFRYGYTDAIGYVGGAVPANSQLLLEIFSEAGCSPIYSQLFTTAGNPVSLGNIILAGGFAHISGTLTNCSSGSVSNGGVIMHKGILSYFYPVTPSGTFNFLTALCSNNTSVNFIGEDFTAIQESNVLPYNLVQGNNTIGNIITCGNGQQEYFYFSINGTSYWFTNPLDIIYQNLNTTSSPQVDAIIQGLPLLSPVYAMLTFEHQNIAAGVSQLLRVFLCSQINASINPSTPVVVNITEYGPIGNFMSGNFSGVFIGIPPPNTVYNITCNFRVIRAQ